jgi:hypothetical protein
LDGKSIGSNLFFKKQKERAHDLKNQNARFNSRIQFASNEAKLVPGNLDPGPHLGTLKINIL